MRITLKKNTLVGLFILYLALLFNFITLKFFGSFDGIEKRIHYVKINRADGYWNFNIEPFKTIYLSFRNYRLFSDEMAIVIMALNIFAFVPMGLLIALLTSKSSFFKTVFIALVIIILIEGIQFVTCLGIADIDDVFLNVFGSILGHLMYIVVSKYQLIKTHNKSYVETAK
ncbi:VanZ family protein [Bacillus sp. FJAT-28004]|uniref:VanZ family protein n=1 Tax=Bacillus sp. FJAT-28004 TaxID=1679165 RepID=UPI0006B63994|nr:VanZ family protein [Bacillus sp. FJAT-28004]